MVLSGTTVNNWYSMNWNLLPSCKGLNTLCKVAVPCDIGLDPI